MVQQRSAQSKEIVWGNLVTFEKLIWQSGTPGGRWPQLRLRQCSYNAKAFLSKVNDKGPWMITINVDFYLLIFSKWDVRKLPVIYIKRFSQ